MAFPALTDPRDLPLDQLFPEAYEASKRMIVRDFVVVGFAIVSSVVLGAAIHAFL